MTTGLASVREAITAEAHGWLPHDASRRQDPLAGRRLPVGAPCIHQFDLANDGINHPVQQVVLVGDVVVERHRLDRQLLAEPAHAQRVDPPSVRELNGSRQHALPVERDAAFSGSGFPDCHARRQAYTVNT